ncbi:MAG: sensor histidine kinase, partial [Candidatus Krumholzibacteria bacterium]|nr:sensor histidine kinase [Candidatus Krumholzibacteria bacterium]
REGDTVNVSIRDNGLGFGEGKEMGIGLSNVRERLKVAYGLQASFEIDSAPGEGASVSVTLPVERGTGRA